LQLLTINKNPGAMLSPSIAHDFELQANGLKLSRGSVANVYCEFFHVLFIPFDCVCLMALEAWSLWLAAFFIFIYRPL
tara:strand:- start:322 stop:555 length:234 start_codon:yes stop_codon:yes gene_type:complete